MDQFNMTKISIISNDEQRNKKPSHFPNNSTDKIESVPQPLLPDLQSLDELSKSAQPAPTLASSFSLFICISG
jgi:hypothetical protein